VDARLDGWHRDTIWDYYWINIKLRCRPIPIPIPTLSEWSSFLNPSKYRVKCPVVISQPWLACVKHKGMKVFALCTRYGLVVGSKEKITREFCSIFAISLVGRYVHVISNTFSETIRYRIMLAHVGAPHLFCGTHQRPISRQHNESKQFAAT